MVSQEAFPKKRNAFHQDVSLWEADALLRETYLKGAWVVSLQPRPPQLSLPSFRGSSQEDEWGGGCKTSFGARYPLVNRQGFFLMNIILGKNP